MDFGDVSLILDILAKKGFQVVRVLIACGTIALRRNHNRAIIEDVRMLVNLNISVGVVLVIGRNEDWHRGGKFFDDRSDVFVDNFVNIFCIRWAGFVIGVRKIYFFVENSSPEVL